MPTTANQATDIVQKVRALLTEAQTHGVHLQVSGYRLDDDWLYIAVVPAKPGVRALEYAEYMSKIERQLRSSGEGNVVLVPALDDEQ